MAIPVGPCVGDADKQLYGSVAHYLAASAAAFCALFLASLPAKALRSIELKRNAGIWQTFQFILWPLGIFWLQPRINDVPKQVERWKVGKVKHPMMRLYSS